MAVAMTKEQTPRLLPITITEVHRAESGRIMSRIGEGTCPWCGWGSMRAEAGQRGFCPVCAEPVLAVLRPGDNDRG